MSQALYRTWRPQTWQEVVGQSHVTKTLQNALQSGRLVHAYLFAGPRGTGKTSTARLLAKAVNCTDPNPQNRPCNQCNNCQAVNEGRFLDLIEIDAASNTSVDDVRDLRDKINFSPSMGEYKVYIIDEVHMLSMSAFNALLKTLEEPPKHAIFVLATTEIHKIPPTVLSRCQRHEFRRISISDIVEQLEAIVKKEKLEFDKPALTLVARQSTGAMRDAISLIDQLASSGKKVTLEYAHQILGTATNQSVIDIVDCILSLETAKGLEIIHTAMDSGIDSRQYARQIVEYLRSILLAKMGNALGEDLPLETRKQIEKHARQFQQDHLIFCVQRFNSTASESRGNWQPSLSLELAFAETCVSQAEKLSTPATSKPINEQSVGVHQPAFKSVVDLTPQPTEPADIPARVKEKEHPQKMERIPSSQTEAGSGQSEEPAVSVAQVPVEPVPPSSGPLDEKSTYRKLRENWDEIRKQIRNISRPVEALFNSCRLQAVNEKVIQIGCNSDFVKSKIDTKENLAIIEPIISRLLGDKITVAFITLKNNPSGSNDRSQTEDGMVNAALGLGGQIIQQD